MTALPLSTGDATPPALMDWLDTSENQLAEAFEQSLEDEATLDMLAQGWRSALSSASLLPVALRTLSNSLRRGGEGTPGSLKDDYPTELFAYLKSGWSTATRAFAMQQALIPFAASEVERLLALADALETAPMPAFCPTPAEVVHRSNDYRLRRMGTATEGTPLLVVASLINRWYVLDFLEGHSFLAMLAKLGRPLYVLEWNEPKGEVDDRSLEALCAGPLLDAVDHLRALHRVEKLPVLGYSMGGTLAAVFGARYPDRVGGVATLCSPVRFDLGGVFARWLSPRYLDVELVARTYEQVPASLVHLPFWWLRPTIKARKLIILAKSFEHPGALNHFLATEVWNFDNVDLTRGVFRSWAGDLYQRDALAKGQLRVDGQAVELSKLVAPTLAISGGDDKIVPPEAVEALVDLCGAKAKWKHRADRCHHARVLTARSALAAESTALTTWLAACDDHARAARRPARSRKPAVR
jgi:polyhydroxyalkanoate synthase